MTITEHRMAAYRTTAKNRWLEEQDELSIRYDRAWIIAKQAAAILRAQFGVHRIVVIDSLTHKQRYHQRFGCGFSCMGIARKNITVLWLNCSI